MGMQMGMALANNDERFLNFKINVKDLNVLYVDTECGGETFTWRY